jgi:hypothetical protein
VTDYGGRAAKTNHRLVEHNHTICSDLLLSIT